MTLRIVHLEDTKPLRDILKATLTAIHPDFELFQFSTTDAALDYIQQNGDKVDLFLLDVRVPGVVDGLGLAEIIKQQGCPGLIVMTSAYMSPGRERLEALDALSRPMCSIVACHTRLTTLVPYSAKLVRPDIEKPAIHGKLGALPVDTYNPVCKAISKIRLQRFLWTL